MARVSVCMGAYNGAKYIKEQIDSILNQLSAEDELVISDDGSTDDTKEIIMSYNDERIHLVQGPQQNLVMNFENAIKHSSGEYIFLADHDDVWLPDKVETMLCGLQQVDVVVSDCIVVDENLKELRHSYFAWRHSAKGFWHNLYKTGYLGCCMSFRREILKRVMPIPRNVTCHDMWIGLVSEVFFKTAFIAEPLMMYRRHVGTVSTSADDTKLSLSSQIYYRLYIFWRIVLRIMKIC